MVVRKDPLEEWRVLCAAMAAHEERAARTASPDDCCTLSGYCCLQCTGLVFELPFRCCYHAACIASSTGCIWLTCGAAELPARLFGHHWLTLREYYYLAHMMLTNFQNPTNPVYIYKPDVRLRRPPHPNCKDGSGRTPGQGDCCCCCTFTPTCTGDCTHCFTPVTVCCETDCCSCMDWFEPLLYREIRSLLCVFSCLSACHCGRCCGPLPCFEDTTARHTRWLREIDKDMDRRTQAFMRAYNPKALRLQKTKSGRFVLINNPELEPKPKGDTPAEAAAPTPQGMLRDSAPRQESSKGRWFQGWGWGRGGTETVEVQTMV